MRTTRDYEVGDYADLEASKGVGWVVFATVMLGLAGIWNFFEGVAAISSAHVYVAHASFVFSDLRTWGWIVLCLGVIQGFAAFSLLSGSEFGRWFGVAAAALNALGQLMFVPAYPWWALAVFSVDIVIVYGLTVYGGSRPLRF